MAVLVAVMVVSTCADPVRVVARAHGSDAADRFERTRAFLLAAYPRLASRSDLQIWFETDRVPLRPRGEGSRDRGASETRPSGERPLPAPFVVAMADEGAVHAQHFGHAPDVRPLFFAFVTTGPRGDLLRFRVGRSEEINASAMIRIRQQIDEHPEWTLAQFDEFVARSGLKFPPAERPAFDAHVRDLLRRLQPLIGTVTITSSDFLARNEEMREHHLPSARLSWVVHGTARLRGAITDVMMSIEPYGGELVTFEQTLR